MYNNDIHTRDMTMMAAVYQSGKEHFNPNLKKNTRACSITIFCGRGFQSESYFVQLHEVKYAESESAEKGRLLLKSPSNKMLLSDKHI